MDIQGYNMPEGLYYDDNHYWVKKEGDSVTMGMNDFARELAGEIVFVQLPFEGKKLKTGKKFAQVESGKWLGKVYAHDPSAWAVAVSICMSAAVGVSSQICMVLLFSTPAAVQFSTVRRVISMIRVKLLMSCFRLLASVRSCS